MYKLILFFEFLKENKDILENLDIHDLNLETIEGKLVPLARENGFFITEKDIFRFLNEYQKVDSGLINDDMLKEVAGGKGNFNRVMATSLLAITGFTGLINNTYTYAMGNADSSVSQSESKTQSVKTIKDKNNNTLSESEMKYYQEKIGDEYKFVSNKGISGSFATAYKLVDKERNEFVLKISNNPENSQRWVQNQRNTDEKIKKYYKDYKGDLRITNYVKIGDDFVIEEYLGERFNPNEIEKERIQKIVYQYVLTNGELVSKTLDNTNDIFNKNDNINFTVSQGSNGTIYFFASSIVSTNEATKSLSSLCSIVSGASIILTASSNSDSYSFEVVLS